MSGIPYVWVDIEGPPKMPFAEALPVLYEIACIYEDRCNYIDFPAEQIPAPIPGWPKPFDPKVKIGQVLEFYESFIQRLIDFCIDTYDGLFGPLGNESIYIDRDGTIYSGEGSPSDGGVNNESRNFSDPNNWGWWVRRLRAVLEDLLYIYSIKDLPTWRDPGHSQWWNQGGQTNGCEETTPVPSFRIDALSMVSPPAGIGWIRPNQPQITELHYELHHGTRNEHNNSRIRRQMTKTAVSYRGPIIGSTIIQGSMNIGGYMFSREQGFDGECTDEEMVWQFLKISEAEYNDNSDGANQEVEDDEIISVNIADIPLPPFPSTPAFSAIRTGSRTYPDEWASSPVSGLVGEEVFYMEQINYVPSISDTLVEQYEPHVPCFDYFYRDTKSFNSTLRNLTPFKGQVALVCWKYPVCIGA